MRLLITGGSGFIGTNAIDFAITRGIPVRNLDLAPPRNAAHAPYWRPCDIRGFDAVRAAIAELRPTHVLHLAARTDLRETRELAGYAANTRGVANLVEALDEFRPERAVFASSMLVCRNGYRPRHDMDYCPDTLYGESKARGEILLRRAAPAYSWRLVRPTSIWGPWFAEPYRNFFEAVARGVYRHPAGAETVKALGYVGNTVRQLFSLLEAPGRELDKRVFYLADYDPLPVREWADRIAAALGAGPVRALPLPLFRAAALAGDLLQPLGYRNPPLTSFRLRNLLTSSSFDLAPIRRLTGRLPYTVDEGIRATVGWLKSAARTADLAA
jgi:nucleoside-diphosphate-sugar epimerase